LYLIVDKNKSLILINEPIQTYFLLKDPNNIIFDMIENKNIDIDYIMEHINTTFYFIVDKYDDTIFLLSADYGLIGILQYYLYLGLDVNYQDKYGSTALMEASWHNQENIVNIILEHLKTLTNDEDKILSVIN